MEPLEVADDGSVGVMARDVVSGDFAVEPSGFWISFNRVWGVSIAFFKAYVDAPIVALMSMIPPHG